MTKEELFNYLREVEFYFRSLRRVDKETDMFCFGLVHSNEIHLNSSKFYQIVDILQPTVTFNPNWDNRHPHRLEAYFYVELNGYKYKLFALLDKEIK